MSKYYNEALQVLSIKEELLKKELEMINDLLRTYNGVCGFCLYSRILRNANRLDISNLRLDFPELKDSFDCACCPTTIRKRCHAYVAKIRQLNDYLRSCKVLSNVESQVVKEQIRIMADRKELYEDEHRQS